MLKWCTPYCGLDHTSLPYWGEALNRAGIEASSKLRKPKNTFYPEAICPSAPLTNQTGTTPSTDNPDEEVLPPNLPPAGQLEPVKKNTCTFGSLLEQDCSYFWGRGDVQNFQQDLASTVLPAEGATKDREKVTTLEADKPTGQAPKIQIKLKK